MGFRVQYKPLCEITVHHGFYLNGQVEDGRVEFASFDEKEQQRRLDRFDLFEGLRLHVPAETERTLKGLGCLVKTMRAGFKVATEVTQSRNAFLPVRAPVADRTFRLRLVLEAAAPQFRNYTNVELSGSPTVAYYLSNRAGQSGAKYPFLSLPAEPYQAGQKYDAGDVVLLADVVYLALRFGKHAAPIPTNPPENHPWLKLHSREYATQADSVRLRTPAFAVDVPAEMQQVADIVMRDQDGKPHAIEKPGAPVAGTLAIDAGQLPAGRYTLTVDGRTAAGAQVAYNETLYLDADLPSRNVLAIVELFHLPGDVLGDFRLYDEAAGFALLDRKFQARLINRHTYWRYRFPKPPQDGDLGELEKVGNEYVTKRAMPLLRGFQRVGFGKQQNPGDAYPKQLPNPSVDHIIPVVNDRIYSDVHLHINP